MLTLRLSDSRSPHITLHSIVRAIVIMLLSGSCLQAAAQTAPARDAQWLRLLHVDTRMWGALPARSDVSAAAFFLTPNGRHDPAAEFAAMAEAIRRGDSNIVCRFPARARYVNEHLQLHDPASLLAACSELNDWLQRVNAHSVVLVFASSYLNSPSSMYGHTLLRFDPPGVAQGSDWLSYAVSFAAVTRADDNSLFYAWKGLAGGYPGTFSLLPYYEKIREYNRLENRDLWEYRLDLTQAEIDRVMLHLWELDGVEFPYYFLDENCAYRLLELIDIARPHSDLAAQFDFTVIPVDTVKVAVDADIVSDVYFRPSRMTELNDMRAQLDASAQQLALRVADDASVLQSNAFTALPAAQQYRVLGLAYRSLRYRAAKSRDDAQARRSHQLLVAMQQNDARPQDAPIPRPFAPERGHPSRMLGLGGGHVAGESDFAELQLRLSYHDLLDRQAGYSKGASLNMGDFRWRTTHGITRLQQADIVEITSLAPRDDFHQPVSWMVRGGAERLHEAADAPLVAHVTGGGGATYSLGDVVQVSLLPGARLEYNSEWNRETDLAAAGMLSLQWQQPYQSLRVAVSAVAFGNGAQRTQFEAGYQFSVNARNALRAHYQRDTTEAGDAQSLSLGYRHYF